MNTDKSLIQFSWKGNFGRFLTAQTVSLFGSALVQYAIVWYVTLSTSSGKMLTVSALCGFLPQIVVSLFAGVLIDRYDRKKIIMFADSLIALSTLALALSFMVGQKRLAFLFVALVVRSLGTGVQTPAVNAVIPQMVPAEKLLRANGISSTLSSLMMFLSPAVSGAVLAIAPLETVLFIDVITAAAGVCITAFVHVPPYEKKKTATTSHLNEIAAGFAYVKQNTFAARILVFQMLILFFISPSAFLTPLMVSRTFGSDVWRLTMSEMTYSLGMICGGLLISVWGGFKRKLHTTLLAAAFYGILMLGLGIAHFFPLYLLLNMLIGFSSPCYNAPLTAAIQERVESDMRGRIFSFMQIATAGALPLGMCVFGPLADMFRVQTLLLGCGATVITVTAFMFFGKRFTDS